MSPARLAANQGTACWSIDASVCAAPATDQITWFGPVVLSTGWAESSLHRCTVGTRYEVGIAVSRVGVDEESVEDMGGRVGAGVEVVVESDRRLRLAERDHALHREVPEGGDASRIAQRLRTLGEDVVGVVATGVYEWGVAHGVEAFERDGRARGDRGPTEPEHRSAGETHPADPGLLRGDLHVGITGSEDLGVQPDEVDRDVHLTGDVVPLDVDVPTELRRVGRPVDEHARGVARGRRARAVGRCGT